MVDAPRPGASSDEKRASATGVTYASARVAVRRPANWWQLVRFSLVGLSGYAVNLSVYALLIGAGTAYILAAVGAFCVAVVNNYAWNRRWTFSRQPGRALQQGLRFLTVSVVGLSFNLALLHGLVAAGLPKVIAQAAAVAAVTPWSFVANKLWSFRS